MRSSGILMHISSLPSKYGIGNFGKEAYEFVDFLKKSGQQYWQMLPLGPTSYGDSPYQSFCAFAGNPYFIDLEQLVEENILTLDEISSYDFGDNANKVDYGKLYNGRFDILYKAFKREDLSEDFYNFCNNNSFWLDDFTLFMALKNFFGGKSWLDWEDENIKLRKQDSINYYKEKLSDNIDFYKYMQYVFFKQWSKLKEYTNSNGIKIIGDVPIYVAMDSSDTWSHTENFQFDENARPLKVAGVPPDYFCADGQLWGNPIFNWEYMKNNNFEWWAKRIKEASKLFDVVRIDHFRGLESYFAVDAKAETAREGVWEKGPDIDLINAIKLENPNVEIIAEDLGFITEEVKNLLDNSGFPGMKVLQFAFDGREPAEYMPHNYPENSVVYTGTHDNTTIMDWFTDADPIDVGFAKEYLGLNEQEGLNWGMIRGALYTNSKLCIIPIQDYLALGKEARMNAPSTMGINWTWRLNKEMLTDELASKISKYSIMYGRK